MQTYVKNLKLWPGKNQKVLFLFHYVINIKDFVNFIKIFGHNVHMLSMYLHEKLKLQIEQFDKNLFARLLTTTPEAPLPSNKTELSNC